MNWLTFITEIVQALAWPVAVIICVALLRQPLSQLVPLLRKLKYRELELEFEQQVKELENKVSVAVPAAVAAEDVEPEDRVLELVEISPRAAVIEACRSVEATAYEAARRHKLELPKPTLLSAIKTLESANLINSTQFSALNVVRHVRNTAAHDSDIQISRRDALEVVRLAKVLESHLANL